MLGLLIKLLPPQAQAGIRLATLLTQALDTPEERQEALDYAISMLEDGKIQVTEWTGLGKLLFWREEPKTKRKKRS